MWTLSEENLQKWWNRIQILFPMNQGRASWLGKIKDKNHEKNYLRCRKFIFSVVTKKADHIFKWQKNTDKNLLTNECRKLFQRSKTILNSYLNGICRRRLACHHIQSVPYHVGLSPSFNAKIRTYYSKNLVFSARKFVYFFND